MLDLTIRLETDAFRPLYEQIYEYIKEEIQNGGLPCHERLPSTRKLAKYLEISRSTVTLAYEQLLSEGYIENRPGSGFYVRSLEGLYHLPKGETMQMPDAGERTEDGHAGIDYDFSPSGVDLSSFPHNAWRKISRGLLMENNEAFYRLGETVGERELRETIAAYLRQARGVNCTARQIVIGAGNDYLLMLLDAVLGKGHIYAIENPSYRKAYNIWRILDREIRTVKTDSHGMCVEALSDSGADIAYVMPSHQFPLGTVMPAGRRMQLLNWAAQKEGRYIIEDDYDSEFRYRGRPVPALKGMDTNEKVIYIGTFSKSIAPAIRISFLVLPESLMEMFEKRGVYFSSTVSRMDQKILASFIRDGYYERHLNRMRAIYKSRHDALLEALKPLQKIAQISGEYAGTHVLLTLKNGLTEAEAMERAKQKGVRVYGLSAYDLREKKKEWSTLILGYANMDEEKIREACKRLAEAFCD